MTTYALIQAGEGYTEIIFVVNGTKEDLIKAIDKAAYGSTWKKNNGDVIEQFRDALISMIRRHDDWRPGRHVLKNIEPHWREWTLVITENQYGDFL